LVRLICPFCKEKYTPDEATLYRFRDYIERFGINKFYRGKGCEECESTGYRGRTAVFEMLKIDERIRYLIARKSPENIIYNAAKKSRMKTLMESGMEKVAHGLTSLEELVRIIDVIVPTKTQDIVPDVQQPTKDKSKDFFKSLEDELF